MKRNTYIVQEYRGDYGSWSTWSIHKSLKEAQKAQKAALTRWSSLNLQLRIVKQTVLKEGN